MSEKDEFTITGLGVEETKCVALLCGMVYNNSGFRSSAYDANRNGAFKDCRLIGDYARALLQDKLNYLIRLTNKD